MLLTPEGFGVVALVSFAAIIAQFVVRRTNLTPLLCRAGLKCVPHSVPRR